MSKTPELIWGKRAAWIRRRLHFNILKAMLGKHKNPLKALKSLRQLIAFRRKQHGLKRIFKFVKSGRQYYWSSEIPGFASPLFDRFIKNELIRQNLLAPENGDSLGLHTIIWGITNRCPLNCSHCYDWKTLKQKTI